MKVNFLIFLITAFLVANTYYDGKFSDYILKKKKYFRMATFAFVGLSIYLFINKNPDESKNLVKHATDLIKYMPVDNNTRDMLTPLFDFTSARDKVNQLGHQTIPSNNTTYQINPTMIRKMQPSTKRSVSETKKKFVASKQNWKCKMCSQQLTHTFQVDHVIDLQFGGTNDVSNLAALCNNCHANKTSMNNL